MSGKPLTTIVEELNNVLTVVAMCTDELDMLGLQKAPMSDLREAVRRGAELTRLLAELRPKSLPPPLDSAPATKATTVLFIDDDHGTRRSVVGAMASRGWRVVDAASVDEAFKQLESVSAIDVLVIDTSMSSRRFASQLVERYPTAAVVYTGGYTNDAPLRDELPATDVSLICRPLSGDTLVSRISEAIARHR